MVEAVRRLRRVWGAPLWAHVAFLAVVLFSFVPVIGTTYSLSPDEAVAMAQARSLADGGGWIVEHPLATVDAENEFYPVSGSSRGQEGMAPFAKHPVYPLVLAALDRLGGTPAMVILSVIGTVAAAGLAALVASELSVRLARPVLWVVGVGSPLLFDAYLLIAHSIGAALTTAAVLCTMRALRGNRLRWLAPAVLSLLVGAVLMRTEALIFSFALGGAVGMVGIARRRWALVALGSAIGATGLVTAVLEKQLQGTLIGSTQTSLTLPPAEVGFWEARWAGLLNTWLRPTVAEFSGPSLLLVIVIILAVAAVVILRYRPQRPQMLVLLSTAGVVLIAIALIAQSDRVVPGLLVAFPATVFGLGLIDRRSFEGNVRLVLTLTTVLFMLGVLATQYPQGGSAEWGGRYFALAVPLLAVLAVDGLLRWSPPVPPSVRRWGAGMLVAGAALTSFGAITSLTSHHHSNQRTLAMMQTVAASTVPGDGEAPVVVTAWANIARFAWPNHSNDRWLHNPDAERGTDLARRLAVVGIEEFVFVGKSLDEVSPYLEHYRIDDRRSVELPQWHAVVLSERR